MHIVGALGEERLDLMLKDPPTGLPDVLVHGGTHATDHPAVAVAVTYLSTDSIGLLGVPELIPGLIVEVTHDLLVLGAVAGHDIAVRIDEEGVERHVARQQTGLAVDVVDKSMVEVGTEPLLGAVGPQ